MQHQLLLLDKSNRSLLSRPMEDVDGNGEAITDNLRKNGRAALQLRSDPPETRRITASKACCTHSSATPYRLSCERPTTWKTIAQTGIQEPVLRKRGAGSCGRLCKMGARRKQRDCCRVRPQTDAESSRGCGKGHSERCIQAPLRACWYALYVPILHWDCCLNVHVATTCCVG